MAAGCNTGLLTDSESTGAVSFGLAREAVAGTGASSIGTQSVSTSSAGGPGSAVIGDVEITYDLVEAHHEELGWIELSSSERTENLFPAGSVDSLVSIDSLDPGHYTQIRLSIVAARVQVDGSWESMKVPGEKLKLVDDFDVTPGYLTKLTLVFNSENSVVIAGASGHILLKPVVRLQVNHVPRYQVVLNGGEAEPAEPISSTRSVEEFYGYGQLEAGGLIAEGLTTYRVGKVFLYQESLTGDVFVVFVQNTSGTGSGTTDALTVDLSVDGSDDIASRAQVAVSDDSGELDLTRTSAEGQWKWIREAKTDGGVVTTPTGPWSFTARLVSQTGMTDWRFRDASGSEYSAGIDPDSTITLLKNY